MTHLLRSDRPYRIRAITRDPTKPAAKKLEAEGVELVQADVANGADLEKAFQGADVVFVRALLLFSLTPLR